MVERSDGKDAQIVRYLARDAQESVSFRRLHPDVIAAALQDLDWADEREAGHVGRVLAHPHVGSLGYKF